MHICVWQEDDDDDQNHPRGRPIVFKYNCIPVYLFRMRPH